MPELNLAIDSQTGKVEGNTKAIQDSIDKNLQWYKVQSAKEELTAIMEEQADVELEVYKINQKIAEQQELNTQTTEDITKATEEMNSEFEKNGKITGDSTFALQGLQETEEDSAIAVKELTEQRDQLTASQSDQTSQIELLNGFIGENTELTEENNEAVSGASEVYTMYGDVVENATTEMKDNIASLNESLEKQEYQQKKV